MALSHSRPSVVTIILCMVASLLLAGVAAIAQPPAPVAAHTTDCDVFNDSAKWVGENDINPLNDSVRAVEVNIDPREATFRVCSHGFTNSGGYAGDSTSALIELQDETTNSNRIQLGIWRCNYAGSDPTWCDTGGNDDGTEVHWFAFTSGCGQGTGTANLGDADFYSHKYKLKKIGTEVQAFIDDVEVWSTKWTTHPRLSCWFDSSSHPIKAQIGAWTADGGDLSAHEDDFLNFVDAAYIKAGTSTWLTPSWSNGPCTTQGGQGGQFDSWCERNSTNGNDFNVWQTHN